MRKRVCRGHKKLCGFDGNDGIQRMPFFQKMDINPNPTGVTHEL